MDELVTFYAKTDGVNVMGVCKLDSEILAVPVEYVVIPAGMKVKIWAKRISGKAVTFEIKYTYNVLGMSPNWKTISSEVLASDGEITIEKRRPIILTGRLGTEAFSITWSQSVAGVSSIELDVEFSDE